MLRPNLSSVLIMSGSELLLSLVSTNVKHRSNVRDRTARSFVPWSASIAAQVA
jgi:hypothetical protein